MDIFSLEFKRPRSRKYTQELLNRATQIKADMDANGKRSKYLVSYPIVQNWFAGRNKNSIVEAAWEQLIKEKEPDAIISSPK